MDAEEALTDALEDIQTRFLLNLPENELSSADRIFFQLEQAHWYYEDFLADDPNSNLPHFTNLRSFCLKLFNVSPLLSPLLPQFPQLWHQFSLYKQTISTYGTILMDSSCSKLLLCRAWKGKSWTLPSGKKNQNEDGIKAAIRETYEETGFDVAGEHGESVGMARAWNELSEEDSISYMEGKKRRTVYICRGVPLDFPFDPVARKEVSEIQFFDVNDLPNHTFNVLPYMKGLRRWMKVSGFGGGGKKGKKGASDRGSSSNQKQRTASSKKERNNSTKKERNASNKKAREQDNEAFGNNASNNTGWSEEEMLQTNEILNNTKISYSGNPHEFSNDGFDPHKHHVVGGSYMNGPGTDGKDTGGNMVNTGAATGGKKIVDEDGFVSFFGDDGTAPWEGGGKEGEAEASNKNTDGGKKKKNNKKENKQNLQQPQQRSPQVVKEQQKVLTTQDKKNTLMSMIGVALPAPAHESDDPKTGSKLAAPNSKLIGATVKVETNAQSLFNFTGFDTKKIMKAVKRKLYQ
ncbi:hypothetical protein TrCOL_g1805 [Triparma columacea]|uniref:Nudix hydrolase domain-containing protein n=1 Tax=Triparma columacea TaxID=722753 RepID=A0A9W7GK40_9STRA|nr:hypothetical protein TrCOL_g1805 [Triparma columacea]